MLAKVPKGLHTADTRRTLSDFLDNVRPWQQQTGYTWQQQTDYTWQQQADYTWQQQTGHTSVQSPWQQRADSSD